VRFSTTDLEYLYGKKFSNAAQVKIARPEKGIPLRINLIEDMVRGRNIIHMGCVDHLPLIEKKIAQNKWLHKRLADCANRCLGIDNNAEGINYLNKKLGYTDVLLYDIMDEKIPDEIKGQYWDFMVMGEIIEHLDNPVEFLKNIKVKYSKYIDSILISVPNSFRYGNIVNTFKNREVINSDHRYWFTPYTLGKIVIMSGMFVEDYFLCQGHPLPIHHFHKKLLFAIFPALRDTLMMSARLNNRKSEIAG
jgi:hypothetical protein